MFVFSSTWSHKNTYLCATPFYVSYCTFHRSFKEKCPLSGAKTQVKYVNPSTFVLRRYRYILLCFHYVATGMYCSGSEFKYPYKLMLYCVGYKLPDSVNKCKTSDLYADLICFVKPWLHRFRTRAPHLSSTSLYCVSYRANLSSMKTHRYEAGYVRC